MSSLEKKFWFILLGIILVIIIGLAIFIPLYNNNLRSNPLKIALDDALAKDDISYCNTIEKVSGTWSKEHCFIKFAEKRGDISLCNNVGYSGDYLDKDFCFAKVAIALRDPSICKKISRTSKAGFVDMTQNQCYKDFALYSGDTSVCDSLDNAPDVAGCKTASKVAGR